MACENLNNVKSGVSKKDGCHYKFKYVNTEDIPGDCKSSSLEMLSECQKKRIVENYENWKNKEYKCSKCCEVMKNSGKYHHNKKCNSQKQ